MTEAFVYKWTNTNNGMMYIGYHKGDTDDGYKCSANSVFWKDYWDNPNAFTREVIAKGTKEQMQELEQSMLKKLNAASNLNYYNKSNGVYQKDKHMKSINTDNRKIALNIIKTRKPIMRSTKEIRALVPFQTKAKQYYQDKVKTIIDRIEVYGTAGINPVVTVLTPEGEQRLDGNHTTEAAYKLQIQELATIVLTWEEIGGTVEDMIILGNYLNKPSPDYKGGLTKADYQLSIRELHDQGVDITSSNAKDQFSEIWGVSLKTVASNVTAVLKNLKKETSTLKIWSVEEVKEQQALLETKHPDAIVMPVVLGGVSTLRPLGILLRDMKQRNKSKGIILGRYNDEKYLGEYEPEELRDIISDLNIDIELKIMPTRISNALI